MRYDSRGIVLAALFLITWVARTISGWVAFSAEQQQHGAAALLSGEGGYVWAGLQATMENGQSEFRQRLTVIVLTAFLVHRGSHESNDADVDKKAQRDRMERRLAARSNERPGEAERPQRDAA